MCRSRSGSAAWTRPIRSSSRSTQPDRLVLGKRMEDHLRLGVCFWHSFAWPGADMFGVGHARPAVARPRPPTRWTPPATKMAVAFEFIEKLGVAVLLLPRPRRRPRGHDASPSANANLDAVADDAARRAGADRHQAPLGHRQPVQHPRYAARRRDQPQRRRLRLRRRPGEEDARGDPAARRRELRLLGRPRGLRHSAQHRPASASSTTSPGSSTWPSTTRRRSASPASSSSSRSRRSRPSTSTTSTSATVPRLPRPQRPRGRLQAQHRDQPRDARRPHACTTSSRTPSANGMLGCIDANRGDPLLGWDTDQFPNSVEDLALPLFVILRGGRPHAPAASTSTPRCAARASSRIDLFHAHIGGMDTFARALLVAADLSSAASSPSSRDGALRRLGRRARHGDPRRLAVASRDLEAQRRGRRDRPRPRRRGARSGSRTSSTSAIWAVDRPRQA